jgi:hypothetical protein
MALVPPAVVTVTSTVPIPAGEVAVIWVALLTAKEAAALLPNLTAVAPEKLVPVMVTLVPPGGTGIWIDAGDGRRRHIGELIRRIDGAGTARGGHRYINGTDPSWRGRGDLSWAVDGERAGGVAAEPDRYHVEKIGASDGYTGAPRRRTGIWIDVGDGRRAKLRLSFAFEANCA